MRPVRRRVRLRLGFVLGGVVASMVMASTGASSVRGVAGPPQFVIKTDAGRIELLDVRGRLMRTLGQTSDGFVALSPDGSQLAWSTSKGLVVGRVSRGAPRLLLPEPPCDNTRHECLYEDAAWSPDGSKLLVSGLGPQRTRLEIVSASTRRGRTIAAGQGFGVTGWSPNGKWMVYEVLPSSGQAIRLVLARGDGSAPRTIARFPTSEVGVAASWSPDSREIAFMDTPNSHAYGQLHVYDVRTGSVRHLRTTRLPSQPIAWSPDSRRFALSLEYGGTEIFDLANGTRHILHAGGEPLAGGPAWTPSGLYMSGLHGIWRSDNGRSRPVPLFTHLPGPSYPPTYLNGFWPIH